MKSENWKIVGSLNENYELPHNIAAGVAFGSFGLSSFYILVIFLLKILKKEPWPKLLHVVLFYSLLLIMGIFVTHGMLTHLGEKTSVYQWVALWIMMIWFLSKTVVQV